MAAFPIEFGPAPSARAAPGIRRVFTALVFGAAAGVLVPNGFAHARTHRLAVEEWCGIDTPGSAPAQYGEMAALLEVTIFQIDVLTLTVRVNGETADRFRSLAAGGEYSEAIADSVAAVMLNVRHACARQRFHRDVSMGRFLGGVRETAEKAMKAGFISEPFFEQFSRSVPDWFSFLEETGAGEGDEIFYEVRGDTLRTVYRTADGQVLMDSTVQGAERRKASIASFFAPGSRFRKRLVESLVEQEERVR